MHLDNHPFGPALRQIDSLSSNHSTLDLPLCNRAFHLYLDPNGLSPTEIADELGVSVRKLRYVREWLILLGLLQTEKGRAIPAPDAELFLAVADADVDSFLELVYFNLCTRNQLMAGLVNVFLADQLVYSVTPTFERRDAQSWFMEFFADVRSENDLRDCFNRFFSPLLRNDGFGPLGILTELEGEKRISIHSHEPHPYVFAYVLGQMAAGRPSVPLEEVETGFNSPGRLFFLSHQQVLALLVRLEREGLVQLDLTASLNQVGLGGHLDSHHILLKLGS